MSFQFLQRLKFADNKNGGMNGRRNLHGLLLHPVYPPSSSGGEAVPIVLQPHHELPSIESPIHVPSLIPISPSALSSGGEPSAGGMTLTALGGNGGGNGSILESSQPASDIPYYTTLQPVQSQPAKCRKRKASGSGLGNSKGKMTTVHVKQEPGNGENFGFLEGYLC